MDLTKKKCVPCEGGTQPFTPEEIKDFMPALKGDWELVENKKIQRQFKFKTFEEAIKFVNQVAQLAEKEGHHPDIHIYYNKVTIESTTHAVGGLSENDFILARKIEVLAGKMK